ncbi:MAG: hypothetical protein ACJZ59_06295 [Candidatus Thalassarchaeaceae archaeon]
MSSRYIVKTRSLVLVFLMITMAQTGYTSEWLRIKSRRSYSHLEIN